MTHANTPTHEKTATHGKTAYTVPSVRQISGNLSVPSSKSLTQRYFNLALLLRREMLVRRPLISEDTRLFLGALEAAGFRVDPHPGESEELRLIPGEPGSVEREIFCGNGGTLFRFMTSALTTVPGTWRLDGVPRLRERTVGPLIEALRGLGAKIECLEKEGFAPLRIHGGSLQSGHTQLDAGSSSQFLSSLLMASLAAPGPVDISVTALTSEPYVDLTLDAVAELGGRIKRQGDVFHVEPWAPQSEGPVDVTVEADFSSVAYPAAAAALAGSVRIDGLRENSRQGDRGLIDLLAEMGAEVHWQGDALEVSRPSGSLRAIEVDLSTMPDQVPTIAALAPFAQGTTRITNVPHLRIKECDRLAAMATELTKAGAEVEELKDGLVIRGTWADTAPPTEKVDIDTWSDHRIAMCMALVSLRRPGLQIRNPGVVAKSYPDFWRDFEKLIKK